MGFFGLLALGPLPFFTLGPWNIGSITIHSFGLMVAIGVLSAHWTSVRRGEKIYAMDGDALRSLGLYMLIIGFTMSHVLNVLMYEPAAVLANPKELFNVTGSLSSYGGVIGAILGWMVWRWRNPTLNHAAYADVAFFGLPVGWLFGRIGCSFAHDHPGALTDFAFAIDFGTHRPGGIRHDLGLYEACWWVVVVAVFFAVDRVKKDKVRHPAGFFTALLPIMYCPVRFGLDFLRVPPELGGDVRYMGLTPAQYISATGFLVGVALMLRWMKKAQESALHEEPPPTNQQTQKT